MSWRDGPCLGLDLETTGTDPAECLPIAFALVQFDWGKVSSKRYALIDPGIEIPAEATAVHGITTAECRERGGTLLDSVTGIAREIIKASDDGVPLVGMNASFDLSVIDHCLWALQGSGLRGCGWRGSVIDVMVIDRALDKYRPGKRTLIDLCRHYGVEPGKSHHAGSDAEAAVRVAFALAEKYPAEVGNIDLDLLHVQQASWRRAWVADFNAYRKTKGQEPIPETAGNWPLLTDERISA